MQELLDMVLRTFCAALSGYLIVEEVIVIWCRRNGKRESLGVKLDSYRG